MNSPGADLEDAKTIDEIARALVRPIVTVIFALAFALFTFMGIVSGEVFASVGGMIFAFWFSSRTTDKQDVKPIEMAEALQKVATIPTPALPSEHIRGSHP